MTKMLTKQQIFDTVATHLLTQNEKALCYPGDDGNAPSCMYLTVEGLKCAVGIFIPKSEYNSDWEHESVTGLFESYPEDMHNLGLEKKYISLLENLQNVHDSYIPDEWDFQLRDVASIFELSTSVMEGETK